MVLTKINMVSSPYVQGLSNFQQYTCRHAELDEHKLMAWSLKIILHDKVSLLFIYIYIYALRHSVSLDNYVSGDQEKKRKIE